MKKVTLFLMGVLLVCSVNVGAVVITAGEATLSRTLSSGVETCAVDYMVTDLALPGTLLFPGHFNFSKGNDVAYDSSKYYFYYQLDNTSGTIISGGLALNIFQGTIVTAGFVSMADVFAQVSPTGPIDPSGSVVKESDSVPNVTWTFPTDELAIGSFSSVLFLTTNDDIGENFCAALGGYPFFEGKLPVPAPSENIPEPLTMLMLGFSVLGIYIRKRIK